MQPINIERLNPTEDMLNLHAILVNLFPFSMESEIDSKVKDLLDIIVVEMSSYYQTGIDNTETRVMESFVAEELHTLGDSGISLVLNMITLIMEELGLILMSNIAHGNIRVVGFDVGTISLGTFKEREIKMYI